MNLKNVLKSHYYVLDNLTPKRLGNDHGNDIFKVKPILGLNNNT